jgi:hypothetical protein
MRNVARLRLASRPSRDIGQPSWSQSLVMADCVEKTLGPREADADGRIAFRTAGIFGIRIRDQLGREMAFSAMQPKCSLEEFFNKIGT